MNTYSLFQILIFFGILLLLVKPLDAYMAKVWWLAYQPSNFQAIVQTLHRQRWGKLVLKNQIELSADQTQAFVEFLTAQESLLKRITSYDKEDAKQAINKVFQLLAD